MGDIEDAHKIKTCSFYENFDKNQEKLRIPNGVYTLDDLKDFGAEQGSCPYYLARNFLLKANIIVFNYSYMMDPKIANIVSAELQKDSVVVFDECHNIDNIAIEVFSLNITNKVLDKANQQIKKLEDLTAQEKRVNSDRLKREVDRLTNKLS